MALKNQLVHLRFKGLADYSAVSVRENFIYNNSKAKHDGYSEVEVEGYTSRGLLAGEPDYPATGNTIDGNVITSDGDVRGRFGVELIDGEAQGNLILDNDVQGVLRGAFFYDEASLPTANANVIYTEVGGPNSVVGTESADRIQTFDQSLGPSDEIGPGSTISARGGNDFVIGHQYLAEVIDGGRGNDLIYADDTGGAFERVGGTDYINGGSGNDHVFAGGGDDTVIGGSGDDILDAGYGDDLIKGGSGNDTVVGGSGNDTIEGGSGDDHLTGNGVISGGSGHDRIVGGLGDNKLNGGSGHDTIVDQGDSGNDTISGGKGDDTVYSFLGGDDVVNGNSGTDTLSFANLQEGVTLNTSTKTAQLTVDGHGQTRFNGFEVYEMSTGSDAIRGSDRTETFRAGSGNDVIRSAGGADTIEGGAGNDVFQYRQRDVVDGAGEHRGVDVITDYAVGDVIDLTDITRGDLSGVQISETDNGLLITADIKGRKTDIVELYGVDDGSVISFGATADILA